MTAADRQLFLILGNPRSGTTMFRMMLNNHPKIYVPPEGGFLVWLHPRFRDADFRQTRNIDAFLSELRTVRKMETWSIDFEALAAYCWEAAPVSYLDMCLCIYAFAARTEKKVVNIFGDKNNFYTQYTPQLRSISPDFRYVCIIRDGRDVACSYRDLGARKIVSPYAPKLPLAIAEIAAEWQTNNRALLELPADTTCFVRYEDILRDSQTYLGQVCAFLDIDFDPAMVLFHEAASTEPADFLQWKEKIRQPLIRDNAGKYKTSLTAEEVREFEAIAGPTLAHFDYPTR